jgi:hypothetical protein
VKHRNGISTNLTERGRTFTVTTLFFYANYAAAIWN